MALNPFQRTESDAPELSATNDRVRDTVEELRQKPFISGRQIENIDLTSGTNTIKHGLGREVSGYVITRKSLNVDIYDAISSPGTVDISVYLPLVSASTVNIDLWVF